MIKSLWRKLVVGGFCVLVLMGTYLVPCSLYIDCPGGGGAWCATYGDCSGNEACENWGIGVHCTCGSQSRNYFCPFVFEM